MDTPVFLKVIAKFTQNRILTYCHLTELSVLTYIYLYNFHILAASQVLPPAFSCVTIQHLCTKFIFTQGTHSSTVLPEPAQNSRFSTHWCTHAIEKASRETQMLKLYHNCIIKILLRDLYDKSPDIVSRAYFQNTIKRVSS